MTLRASIATAGSLLFMAALVLSPAPVLAQTPQDVGAGGSFATIDDAIVSTARDPLVTTTASLDPGHMHTCVVIASAATRYDGGANGRYIFELLRNGVVVPGAVRIIDFTDTAGVNDPNKAPVATNRTFSPLSGNQTFTFTARKDAAGNATLFVEESAISVICQLSGGI
jgi:hypothetical protein